MAKVTYLLWLFLIAVQIYLFFLLQQHLPERFPTHFDLTGQPNGWMTKGQFMPFFGGLYTFTTILLLVLYHFVERLPSSMVNLPNKAYWFSTPEMTQQAYLVVRKIIALSGVFGSIVFLFASLIIYQESGQTLPVRISVTGSVIGIFVMSGLLLVATKRLARPTR